MNLYTIRKEERKKGNINSPLVRKRTKGRNPNVVCRKKIKEKEIEKYGFLKQICKLDMTDKSLTSFRQQRDV